MARDIQQIYNEIIAQKNILLPELTDTRPQAVWNRFAYIFATITSTLEQVMDTYTADLINITNGAAYGSKDWIKRKCYEFQYSTTDPQVIAWNPLTYRYEYPSVNDTLKIITQASVQVAGANNVRVKLAKGQIGSLSPLDAAEQSAVISYFSTISPAGQFLTIISEAGDTVDLEFSIWFDGQIPNSTIQNEAQASVQDYLNNVAFDGVIYASKLVDAIQAGSSVINCVLENNGGFITNIGTSGAPQQWYNSVICYAGYAGTVNITFNLYPQ